MRTVRLAGDRLLGVFLPKVDAGACIRENGQCCGCQNGWQKHFNCVGACLQVSLRCPKEGTGTTLCHAG